MCRLRDVEVPLRAHAQHLPHQFHIDRVVFGVQHGQAVIGEGSGVAKTRVTRAEWLDLNDCSATCDRWAGIKRMRNCVPMSKWLLDFNTPLHQFDQSFDNDQADARAFDAWCVRRPVG